MADFVIRPAGDADFGNALFVDGELPLNAVDAAVVGITMGTEYEIGRVGDTATLRVTDVPAIMGAPSLSTTTGQVTVTLAPAPTDNGAAITSYDLRHQTDGGAWTEVSGITSPHDITGLTNAALLGVQIRAVNSNGAGDWSASATITVDGGVQADVVPAAIGSDPALVVSGTSDLVVRNGLSVTFLLTSDPADIAVVNRVAAAPRIADYDAAPLDASVWNANGDIPFVAPTVGANPQVTLTVPEPGEYALVWEGRTFDHADNPPDPRRWSAAPNGSVARVILDTAPAAMAAPTLAATEDTLTVTFGADPSGGFAAITSRDIHYRATGSVSWITLADEATGRVITGLTSGTQYEVQTRATNDPGGAGAWSPSATVSTTAVPQPPVINSISIDGTTITADVTDADDTTLTAVWASADPANNPTYTIAGGWSGTTFETGTFAVTEGGDTDTITLTDNTPEGAREVTLYFHDGNSGLVGPERLAFTKPAETAAGGMMTPVRLLATPYTNSVRPTTTPHTTASVTPTGGAPVIVAVHTLIEGGAAPNPPTGFTFGGAAFDTVYFRNQGSVGTYVGVVENPGTSAQAAAFQPGGSGTRAIAMEILEISGAATTNTIGAEASALGTGAVTLNLTTQNAGSIVLFFGTRDWEATGLLWEGADGAFDPAASGTDDYFDITAQIAWEAAPTAGAVSAVTNTPATAKVSGLVALEVKAA